MNGGAADPGAQLGTARMVLRRFTSNDVDLLVELDSDIEVMRFLTGRTTDREEVRDVWMPRILAAYRRHPGFGRWAAQSRDTGEFLGWFGLRIDSDADPSEVELGYRLRRAAWGRGLATEGGRVLVDYAFSHPQVRRIFAETMSVNTGSRRVLEKLGLSHVRTTHRYFDNPLPGSDHGEVEYELLRADWAAPG